MVLAELVDFMPKSATSKVNVMSLVLCVHMPTAILDREYPKGARCFVNCSFTIFPACGRSYIPFLISQYTHPLTAISKRLYCWMISSGMMSSYSFMFYI